MNKSDIKNQFIFLLMILLVFSVFVRGQVPGEDELNSLSDEILVQTINTNPKLLENDVVMNEIFTRSSNNVSFLNQHSDLKKMWLSRFEITDEGGEIEKILGTAENPVLKTKGELSTTFNLKDVPGARIKEDGSVVLKNGVKIASSTISRDDQGILNLEEGVVDLTGISNKEDFILKNSLVREDGFEFKVKKATHYFKSKSCIGVQDCIQNNLNRLEVLSGEGNKIDISLDKSTKDIMINKVGKGSLVSVRDSNNNLLQFKRNNILVDGDLSTLTNNIQGTFEIKNKDFEMFFSKEGKLIETNGKIIGGLYNLKPTGENNLLYKENAKEIGDSLNKNVFLSENAFKGQGGNLYVRGASLLDNLAIKKNRKESTFEKFLSNSEIYSMDEKLIAPATGDYSSINNIFGTGKTPEEAVANALISAAYSREVKIKTGSVQLTEEKNVGKTFSDYVNYFRSRSELSAGTFIKKYILVRMYPIRKNYYKAVVNVDFGELIKD